MLSEQGIERAAAVLRRGEAAILPSDTVPGLFMTASPGNDVRLRKIKKRSEDKPFALMFSSKKQLEKCARIETRLQKKAVTELLPGRLTLILPASASDT